MLFLVPTATVIRDDSAASAFMRAPGFDPQHTVVLDEDISGPLPPDAANAADPNAHVGIVAYRANTMLLEVKSTRPALLLLSEIYYPGWQASVDGAPQPVYRADWNLRAIPVAAGSHTIVMNFLQPRSFRLGAFITALTLVAVALTSFASGRRRTVSESR